MVNDRALREAIEKKYNERKDRKQSELSEAIEATYERRMREKARAEEERNAKAAALNTAMDMVSGANSVSVPAYTPMQEKAAKSMGIALPKDSAAVSEGLSQLRDRVSADNAAAEAKARAEDEKLLSYDSVAGQAEIDKLSSDVSRIEELPDLISNAEKWLADYEKRNWDYRSRYKHRYDTLTKNLPAFKSELDELNALYEGASLSELNEKLREARVYHSNAEKYQALDKITREALEADNFEKYSNAGAVIENPTFNEANRGIEIFGWHPFGEKVGNPVTYSRENAAAMRFDGTGYNQGNYLYQHMTDEEVKIYNYYLAKYGKDKASEYIDVLESYLVDREAQNVSNMYNDTVAELPLNFIGKIEETGANIFQGARNAITGSEKPIQYSPTSTASQYAMSDNKGLWKIANDTVATAGGMLPSILVGTINPIAGAVVMGASSAGNAYNEMIQLGYSVKQARAYGTLVGGAEAGLSYLLGGISKLGGKATGKLAAGVATKLDNALAKVAITHPLLVSGIKTSAKLGISTGGEIFEEEFQLFLEPLFKSWVTNETYLLPNFEEIAYTAIVTALSTGVIEGTPTIASDAAAYNHSKQLGKSIVKSGELGALKKLGKTAPEGTAAYQLADFIDKDTNGYATGQYFKQVGKELSEQNVKDLVKGLERRGYSAERANTVAGYINKALSGEELSRAQWDAVYGDEAVVDVMRSVFFNENHSVNQRNAELDKIGRKAELEMANRANAKNGKSATPSPEVTASTPYNVLADSQIAVGDTFKDAKTGNTITVVERDGEKTIVTIDTGKKVETRTFTNSQADNLATNEQFEKIGGGKSEQIENAAEANTAAPEAATEDSGAVPSNVGMANVGVAVESELDNITGVGYNRTTKESDLSEIRGNQDSRILEGQRGVRGTDGSRDGLWTQGNDTEEIYRRLGECQARTEMVEGTRAGTSGVLGTGRQTESNVLRFAESVLRNVRGLKVGDTDTAGRTIPESVRTDFSDTVFKDENGKLLSLYHWTDAKFVHFLVGDIGFHFGTLKAAYDRFSDISKRRAVRDSHFKEVYLNIKNPVFLDYDPMRWVPFTAAYKLNEIGVISDAELEALSQIRGFKYGRYDSPAMVALRELLNSKGYDGIVYSNSYEDGISVIAFDDSQIYTVAENGVDVVANGVAAISENASNVHAIASAIENTLRPEIASNPEFMGMLTDRFGGDWIESLSKSITEQYGKDGTIDDFKELFVDDGEAVYEALSGNRKNGVRYSIDESFSDSYDSWVKRGRPDREAMSVGTTSEALKSIGVKNQKITWDTSKINKSLKKHTYLNDELMKSIPDLLESPIIVMQSKQSDSRITLFGEVYDGDGLPVMAVLELLPLNRAGTIVLDEIKIVSTHSRKTSTPSDVSQTQNLIRTSDILYVDPNKKRTDSWLMLNRLQLPLSITAYGPIKSITYPEGNVNAYSMQNINDYSQEDVASEKSGNGLLSGNSRRQTDASTGEQIERVSAYKQSLEGKTKTERKEYAKQLLEKGLTEEKIDTINSNGKKITHKYTLVKPEGYNDDMRSIVAEAEANGKKVGFFVGFALRQFDGQRNFLIDGIKVSDTEFLLRYDGDYSPQSLLKHEDVHAEWNTPEMQKAKDAILDGISDAEKKRLLSDGRYKDYSELYKNDDAVWQEFVADVFAGMNDYTARFINIVAEYDYSSETVDRYNPREYNDIIDAGGNSAVLNDVRFGDDNLLSERGTANGYEQADTSRELGRLKNPSKTKRLSRVGEVGQAQSTKPNTPHTKRVHRSGVSAETLTSSGLTAEQAILRAQDKIDGNRTEFYTEARKAGVPKTDMFATDHTIYYPDDAFDRGTVVINNGVVSFTEKRLNDLIEDFSVPKGGQLNQNYAKGYVAYISPNDFLALTAVNEQRIIEDTKTKEQYGGGKLDPQILSDTAQTPFLEIDFESGVVTAHEGRHRMVMLRDAGAERVAIVVKDIRSEAKKYHTKKLTNVSITGQKFNTGTAPGKVTIDEIIPLSPNYRNEVREKFVENEASLRYALSPDVPDAEFWQFWLDKIKEHGAIPKGENPARDINVPRKISEDKVVSRFARTLLEAGITPDENVSDFEKAILDGKMTYEVVTNKKAKEDAINRIKKLGFQEALRDWEGYAREGRISKENFVFGMELYNQCITNKDVRNAMKIAAELASEATRAGQTVQACRMLKLMTPDGQLYYLEKSIQKMNEEFRDKLGDKYKDIVLDEELMTDFLGEKDEEKRNIAYDKLCQNIADQIPATALDKWNAWRYLAMLGTPRTHLKNVVGNAVFLPTVRIKNYVGAVIEKSTGLESDKRTKSLRKTKEAVEFAKKDFEAMKKVLQGENAKYAVTSDIEGKRTIFKTKWLEFLRRKNFDFLEAEDMWFLRAHYVDALARLITVRNIDVNSITSQALEAIRAIAVKEAQAATYRDANSLAEGLNRLQRKLEHSDKKALRSSSVLLEGVMPFKKTPMNIAKQGINYSPIGLLKGIYTAATKLKSGDATAADVIDDFSKGLTGTMIMLLGYFLASLGFVVGAEDKSKKEKEFDKMVGEQSYSLKVGDAFTYTLDWMAPSNLPLFTGVKLYDLTQDDFSFADVVDALSTIAEPLLELSVFSGVSDMIETAQYSDSEALIAIGTDMATSYVLQALPTIGGQLSRMIDKNKREYYYVDKNSNIPKGVQQFIGQASSKIPFASFLFAPAIDEWGREETYGNAAERVFENTISPGYYAEDNYTWVDRELKKLYERTGESSVLPVNQQKYYKQDGIYYYMSAEDYAEVKKMRGQKSFEYISKLLSGEIVFDGQEKYSLMSDDEKVKYIKKCYDKAGKETKDAMFEKVKRRSE